MALPVHNFVLYRNENAVFIPMIAGAILSLFALVVCGLSFVPPASPVAGTIGLAVVALYGLWWAGNYTSFYWQSGASQQRLMDEYMKLSKSLRKEIGVKPRDIMNMNAATAGDFRLKVERLYRKEQDSISTAHNPRLAELMSRVDNEIGTLEERERVMGELG